MAFKRVDKDTLPPRRWALKGRYGDGKSTFILALRQPALIVDADGRRHELKGGELYELSEEPADNRSVERIQDLLDQNMPGSGIKTVAIDSITSLIGSSIARAMLDNAADRNVDKNQAWVDKAEKMRLLQDSVTAYGSDVLWVHMFTKPTGIFINPATCASTIAGTSRGRRQAPPHGAGPAVGV
jgi:hypothetical protein